VSEGALKHCCVAIYYYSRAGTLVRAWLPSVIGLFVFGTLQLLGTWTWMIHHPATTLDTLDKYTPPTEDITVASRLRLRFYCAVMTDGCQSNSVYETNGRTKWRVSLSVVSVRCVHSMGDEPRCFIEI